MSGRFLARAPRRSPDFGFAAELDTLAVSTWNRLASAGDAKARRAIIEEKQLAERRLKADREVSEFRTWLQKLASTDRDSQVRLRAAEILKDL